MAYNFRTSVGSRVRLAVPALALSLMASAPSSAWAQGGGTAGPGGVDYAALTTTFSTAITPIMTTVLPVGLVILGIWMAPRLLKRMIKTFAGG